jgi:hypothetical protein
MQTMKQYLALIATLAAAVCHAQVSPAGSPPSDLRRVAVQKPSSPAPHVTPRQLSAQERAELRRQIYQYSRLAGKGS